MFDILLTFWVKCIDMLSLRELKKEDIAAAILKDPAAKSKAEVKLTYGGFRALCAYRKAHRLWEKGKEFRAKLISSRARKKYGVDIHPAAKIGRGVFIDHGVGVVIGETAEVGDDVTIYQGATLGGTGKDVGKRHPTIGKGVIISAGAKILGPVTIGEGCKIGAGSVVLKDVPPFCTVVGVPGRVVKMRGQKVADEKPIDPVLEEFGRLNRRLSAVEESLGIASCKYSISNVDIISCDYINGDGI